MNKSQQIKQNADDSMLQNLSMQTQTYNYFKIVLLGNTSVGKTSILKQFTEQTFSHDHLCTVSVDYKVKSIIIDDNTWVEMYIWDTCGQERFRTITRQYYKDSKGGILVFDITQKNSFNELQSWIDDLKRNGDDDITITIVGNKSDLVHERAVSFQEAKEFADLQKFEYFEISAKSGENINNLFEVLCKSMIKRCDDTHLNISKKDQRKSLYINQRNLDRSKGSNNKRNGCC